MENSSSQSGTRAKSAIRALDILETLARQPDGLSFTELQRLVRFPKSSLHELLTVLTGRGYVECDPESRGYRLGIRVWENGQAYLQHHDLVRDARPVMDGIVAALNETVQLAILDGIENVYLAKVDCSHPIRLQSEVGRRLFAHGTGLGKVLLASLPDQELLARLPDRPLPRFTAHTITDRTLLLRELARVRERGFAVDNQEYTAGLRCVAVPIHDHRGRVTAAMSASIPIMRATAAQLALALRLLAEGSLRVSRRLGCAHDDPRLTKLLEPSAAAHAVAPWDTSNAREELATV